MYDPFDMTEETENTNANEKESKTPIIDSGERMIYARNKVRQISLFHKLKLIFLVISVALYGIVALALLMPIRETFDKDGNVIRLNLITSEKDLKEDTSSTIYKYGDPAYDKLHYIEENVPNSDQLLLGFVAFAVACYCFISNIYELLKTLIFTPYHKTTLWRTCYNHYEKHNAIKLSMHWILHTITLTLGYFLIPVFIPKFFNSFFSFQKYIIPLLWKYNEQSWNFIINPAFLVNTATVCIILGTIFTGLVSIFNRLYKYLTDIEVKYY